MMQSPEVAVPTGTVLEYLCPQFLPLCSVRFVKPSLAGQLPLGSSDVPPSPYPPPAYTPLAPCPYVPQGQYAPQQYATLSQQLRYSLHRYPGPPPVENWCPQPMEPTPPSYYVFEDDHDWRSHQGIGWSREQWDMERNQRMARARQDVQRRYQMEQQARLADEPMRREVRKALVERAINLGLQGRELNLWVEEGFSEWIKLHQRAMTAEEGRR